MNTAYREIDDGLREELQRALGRHRFRLWFRDTRVVDVGENGLTLAVPTDVHRTWLHYTFGAALQTACERVLGEGTQVHLRVSAEQQRRRALRDALPQGTDAWEALLAERRAKPSLETFVATGNSRFPRLILRQLLEGGSAAAMHYLQGPCGSGKTHLLRGLEADANRRRPGAALYLTTRRFTQRYVDALRAGAVEALRAFEADLGSRRFVLIDDLDELDGRPATQRALVRLLDASGPDGPRVVLAGRGHPARRGGLSPRLRSRIEGGVVLALSVADRGCLEEILDACALRMGRALTAEVRAAVLERTSSVQGAVDITERWALASARVGRALGPEWLGEVAPHVAATAREEVIRRAKDAVATHFGIDRRLLERPTKVRAARFPRRVAMYLVYRACAMPLAELGSAFGLRSHSSVSRAIREMRTLRSRDPAVEQLADGLLARL